MLHPSSGYWFVLFAANIPIYLGAGRVLFRSWRAFWETVRISFTRTPDISLVASGEWAQSFGVEFKLFSYIAGCTLLVMLEHLGLAKLGLVGSL